MEDIHEEDLEEWYAHKAVPTNNEVNIYHANQLTEEERIIKTGFKA